MAALEHISHHMRIRQDQPIRVNNKASPISGKDFGRMLNPLATYPSISVDPRAPPACRRPVLISTRICTVEGRTCEMAATMEPPPAALPFRSDTGLLSDDSPSHPPTPPSSSPPRGKCT